MLIGIQKPSLRGLFLLRTDVDAAGARVVEVDPADIFSARTFAHTGVAHGEIANRNIAVISKF